MTEEYKILENIRLFRLDSRSFIVVDRHNRTAAGPFPTRKEAEAVVGRFYALRYGDREAKYQLYLLRPSLSLSVALPEVYQTEEAARRVCEERNRELEEQLIREGWGQRYPKQVYIYRMV